MPITTIACSSQASLLLSPAKTSHSLHRRFNKPQTHLIQTLTFSPITPKLIPPIRYTVPSKALKTRAGLIPLQFVSTILPSSPKQTLSVLLSIALAFTKRVISRINIVSSFNDFKEPLVVVVQQMGKWVDLFHSILMVRVLLGWFPNLPWEKQPFSALRDLCDPFLSFCRTILPPLDTPGIGRMDYSPLLAFAFLGVLGNLLKGPGQSPAPM